MKLSEIFTLFSAKILVQKDQKKNGKRIKGQKRIQHRKYASKAKDFTNHKTRLK
jgi:hypothetical protein